ncbi:MAG: rhodanese-like domain-containing protein [Candidatus Bathyarchaeia archaeon]|nr:hypothetical protein [Candidatus Bathyarchaeota archaeon]
MKKILVVLGAFLILGIFSSSSLIRVALCFPLRSIPPIVSTDWLYENLDLPGLIVLDIRSPEEYNAGHIPGAINVPSYMWYTNPPFGEAVPWMEMPPQDYLFELIGNSSITRYSRVVVVGSTSGPLSPVPFALYNTATITRVAITLLYAGLVDVAILDGGYDKWVADGYPVEITPNVPTLKVYSGILKKDMIVSKEYVASRVGRAVIVDSRDLEVYLGFIQEPWTARPGHIPTARSFSTPWLWNIHVNVTTGMAVYTTYRDIESLRVLAECIIGADKEQEVIIYCGVGGYASTMYFILAEVLGYTNVKIYDGSAQEWTADLSLPVVYEGLGSEYMELSRNYTMLRETYDSLRETYDSLQRAYNDLQEKYNSLQKTYNDLRSSYDKLSSDYSKLKGDHEKLTRSYEELLSKYNTLVATTVPSQLLYMFIATTIIFIIVSIYLAIKVRRVGRK